MEPRRLKDLIATQTMRFMLIVVNFLVLLIGICLFIKAWPIFSSASIADLLLSSSWQPFKGSFGFYPFIVGTLEVTAIAMILAVPVCLLSAIYLSEYAHRGLKEFIRLVVDILAGIPSVIYGLWGVIVIVPLIRALGQALGYNTTGYSLLAGGIILAIMIIPVIISVSLEVFATVPMEVREVALALGTTKWETVRHVVLRKSLRGIMAAIVMGVARALGETIAVLMVVGNVAKVPHSLFDPAYPLPALIANNYGEMMSIPLYDSALMLAALILMVVVGGFSLAANITLLQIERRAR